MADIDELLKKAELVNPPQVTESNLKVIISRLVDSGKKVAITKGEMYAALFDLLVSVEYYHELVGTKWTYCDIEPFLLLYPFVNACPRCLGNKDFVYTTGKKPGSGQIGKITTKILLFLLQSFIDNKDLSIYKASEPIDAILYNQKKKKMLIAEVKSSPLLTIPLATYCDQQYEQCNDDKTVSAHSLIDCPSYKKEALFLYFPKTKNLPEKLFPIKIDWNLREESYQNLIDLTEHYPHFGEYYLNFWKEAYETYISKDSTDSVFWITNACGSPSPLPNGWPIRSSSGGGVVTISDKKSSVGMDRTDDIKKGAYQVLKLGAEYKPIYGKEKIKTVLLSNIHAIRHFDEYFSSIKDIIWTIDKSGTVETVADIPLDYPIYNLFDGIIAFTKSEIRDKFVKKLFGDEQ